MARPKHTGEGLPAIDTATLLGDVRDALLGWFRQAPDAWSKLDADQQREMIDRCTVLAEHVVVEAVRLTTAKGFPTISGRLVKCLIKDGMQLQIDVSRHDPQRLVLIDNLGRPVVLVIAELDMFAGEKGPPKTTLEGKLGL